MYCLMVTLNWKEATERQTDRRPRKRPCFWTNIPKIGQNAPIQTKFYKFINTKYFIEVLKCRDDINIQMKMKTKIKR